MALFVRIWLVDLHLHVSVSDTTSKTKCPCKSIVQSMHANKTRRGEIQIGEGGDTTRPDRSGVVLVAWRCSFSPAAYG
jgi:hypothetical protein